jgi:DNA-binding transcriptional LysR family regulator
MRLEGIDTHLVVPLHALLVERNVTRAARRVGLTQPSMSHALRRLRAHYRDELLVQVGRTMVLTERARALVGPVAEAIGGLERVFGDARPFDAARATSTFRIATSDNLALFVLPRLAALLAKEAPHVRVRCTNIGPDWADHLRRGELDLKLGRAERGTTGLRTKVLFEERLVCVVRKGHPASRGALTAARYAAFDHLLVAPREGDTSAVDRVLAGSGLARRVVMTLPHFLVAPFVVARSDLVLTVSQRVAATFAPALGLAVVPCPLRLPGYGLAQTWAESTAADEAQRWLRAAVERAARGA